MVAKSYQSLKQIGEPYTKNGKQYVVVLNEKTGNKREVRWYTNEEYVKYYGNKPDKATKSQKEVFGFDNGYITIFKGDTYSHLEWFRASIAKYNKLWGWAIASTESVPFDLPCGLEPIELHWDQVGDEQGWLKSDEEIKKVIESLMYEESDSVYMGEIGDRLDLEITVTTSRKMNGYYGETTVHYMEDTSGNQYLWNTASKNWEAGEKYHIKATVKDHKIIHNVKTTILTRCTLVK